MNRQQLNIIKFQREGVGKEEEWTTTEMLKLIRTANMADMVIRKDGINYHFQADFIKSII